MKILMDKGCYELSYDSNFYENLEFIRMDSICGSTYITMKNILSEEIITFDQAKITWIRKKAMLTVRSRYAANLVAESYAP